MTTKQKTPHEMRVQCWVETRPRSVRIPNGRADKHPRKGHKNDWRKSL